MKTTKKTTKKTKKRSIDQFNRIFLSKTKIGNLKAFKGENEIEFAPMINLVFGKNSSGKSTINQALRLFRQSYGFNKLTPFNYESPPELRGKGGLDIDVGYSGLVNNGNLSSKISLGVETGIYLNDKKEISKNKKTLHYTYKFKKKFYTGKNLVSSRTILDKIYYSNPGGEVLVELPKPIFFEDDSDLGKTIREKEMLASGEYFFRDVEKKRTDSDNIYKSVYHPYYYKTIFKPQNLKINSIEKIFFEIKETNNSVIESFYYAFLEYLKKKKSSIEAEIKNKKSKNKINNEVFGSNFLSHRREMQPLAKKVSSIRKKNNGNITKQISDFLKIRDDFFKVYEDEYIDFDVSKKVLGKNINKLITNIYKLINFFNKSKYSKDEFIDFFKKDICLKNKDIIFFNGHFINNPKKRDKDISIFRAQHTDDYLINILIWAVEKNSITTREVNIFSGYQRERFARSAESTMEDISKAMNKFLVVPGLREIPKRYFVKGLQTDYVGPSAENLGELLANPEINKATNNWFQKLEIPYKVDIQKSGNYYEIIFSPKNSKIKISSMHIGLGYPLILPFIVQCIIAKNKIILIEEPEVHLHPKIQADLADLIVESSLIRNNQFIIETHSEDLLLRVLKSIRQGKLKPEDVSVNYITPDDKKGSKINKITINKFGQYTTSWHDNLFAERRREFES